MYLTRSGDYLYFTADDGIHGRELWKLDRQNRISMVVDLVVGENSREISLLQDGDGFLYFSANGVYRSGGTVENTVRISDSLTLMSPGHVLGDSYYLVGGVPATSSLLRAANGPTPSLHYVTDVAQEMISVPVGLHPTIFPFNKCLYLSGTVPRHNKLTVYVIDERGSSVAPLLDVAGNLIQSEIDSPDFCAIGDVLYFNLRDNSDRHELWMTTGTEQSARRVYAPPPGVEFNILKLARAGSTLILLVNEPGIGRELWRSDGTSEGTQLLKDITPGPANSMPYQFWSLGDHCIFIADQPDYGNELWITDGSTEGTRLLKDLVPGPRSSDPYQLLPYRDWLLFSCENYTYGEELWRTDGTPEGTTMVKDINPGLADSGPYHLREFNGKVYFSATHPAYGEELWESDATPEGTRLAARIKPALRAIGSSYPRHLTPFRDYLYFTAEATDGLRHLFRTRGSTDTTEPVLPQLLERDFTIRSIEVDTDSIYITTENSAGLRRFWKSGGEPENTLAVSALPDLSSPSPLDDILSPETYQRLIRSPLPPDSWATLNGRTYFPAYARETGSELWVADHDTGEASLFFESMAGPASGSPSRIRAIGSNLWFVADDSNKGKELWISDGSQSGTRMIGDFNVLPMSGATEYVINSDGELFALTQGAYKSRDLHWFQPPEFGTPIPIIIGNRDTTFSEVSQLTVCGNDIYFTATNTAYGNELWKVVRRTASDSATLSTQQVTIVCNIAPDQIYDEQAGQWLPDGRVN